MAISRVCTIYFNNAHTQSLQLVWNPCHITIPTSSLFHLSIIFCFLYFVCFQLDHQHKHWCRVIHCSISNIPVPGATYGRKLPLTQRLLTLNRSSAREVVCEVLFHMWLIDFDQATSDVVGSWMQWPCHVEKIVFCSFLPKSLSLALFLHLKNQISDYKKKVIKALLTYVEELDCF